MAGRGGAHDKICDPTSGADDVRGGIGNQSKLKHDGARLARLCGDGWIACGDAAICFDPVSGQGIFSALHSGVQSGLAVADALDRDSQKPDEYASRMEGIWEIYRRRTQALYRSERRWAAEPFWSLLAAPVVPRSAACAPIDAPAELPE